MAPPHLEHNSESATAGESHRSIPTPFLTKTYHLVDDHSVDDVISWNDDGSSFVVWNTTVFARDLLPKFFKHNNFSSFIRQLNTYGFRKVVPDRWEFSNENFRRGEKRRLCEIRRRKVLSPSPPASSTATIAVPSPLPLPAIPTAKPIVSPSNSGEEQVVSSSSSPLRATAEILEENDRLSKENVRLNKELAEMRSLCSYIFTVMSNYTNFRTEQCSSSAAKPLDLMATKRSRCEETVAVAVATEDRNPKLFGVTIGVRRAREEERGAENDTVLRLHQAVDAGVKSEPLDCETYDNQQASWLNRCHRANRRVCN